MGGCCCRENCSTPFTSIFEMTLNNIDGIPIKLSCFRGKVIVVVNVASE